MATTNPILRKWAQYQLNLIKPKRKNIYHNHFWRFKNQAFMLSSSKSANSLSKTETKIRKFTFWLQIIINIWLMLYNWNEKYVLLYLDINAFFSFQRTNLQLNPWLLKMDISIKLYNVYPIIYNLVLEKYKIHNLILIQTLLIPPDWSI